VSAGLPVKKYIARGIGSQHGVSIYLYKIIYIFFSTQGNLPLTIPFHTLYETSSDAGWSSLVARWAHNPKVVGSNPTPATTSFNRLAAIFE
jgi:hypothetical protein